MSPMHTLADAKRVSAELAQVRNRLDRVLGRLADTELQLSDVRSERDHQHQLAEQLRSALENSAAIEQAIGIIAEKAHVDVTEARARLKSYSRGHAEKLRTIAHAVVAAQDHERERGGNPEAERVIAAAGIPAEFWDALTLNGAIFE